MYKNVLLPIDLNHEASWRAALPQAAELVRASGGVLHVMTVLPDMGAALVENYFPDDYRETALKAAEGAVEALIKAHVPEGVSARPHLGYGKIHDCILSTMEDVSADLIVMASHAPDRVREFLVGSQADRVVRRSPVSVLIVRA
ncbi:MAG: nucleotide-binding universal stress UspA family protein [Paracoccaceae bacterium]|jgi:nucleotide-binding universal stress UspA family protein